MRNGNWQTLYPAPNIQVNAAFRAQDGWYLGSPEALWSFDLVRKAWKSVISFVDQGLTYAAWLQPQSSYVLEGKGREWFVQSTGGFLTRKSGQWKKIFWFDEDTEVARVGLVNGAFVAMSGIPPYAYPRITIWNEDLGFQVHKLQEWGVDPDELKGFDMSEDGTVVLTDSSGQLTAIDLSHDQVRHLKSPTAASLFKVFVRDDLLILIDKDAGFQEKSRGDWNRVLSRDSAMAENVVTWEPLRATMDEQGRMWLPLVVGPQETKHELLRLEF